LCDGQRSVSRFPDKGWWPGNDRQARHPPAYRHAALRAVGGILAEPADTVEPRSIGLGIFLFVVGAILTFAVNVSLDWINLDLVGSLLMGAGVVVTIIGLVLLGRSRKAVTTERTVTPAGETVAERSTKVSGTEQP
jgi:Domain of unknown function (DUF6458)